MILEWPEMFLKAVKKFGYEFYKNTQKKTMLLKLFFFNLSKKLKIDKTI